MLSTTIVLEYQVSQSTVVQSAHGLNGYLLKMQVSNSTNIDPKIFVFHREVRSDFTPSYIDEFYSIASVAELASLPADSPEGPCPFYRTDSIELVFESASALTDAIAQLQGEISELKRANNDTINLLPTQTITIQ